MREVYIHLAHTPNTHADRYSTHTQRRLRAHTRREGGSKVVGHEVRQLGDLMSSVYNVATREQRGTPLCYLSIMAHARLSSRRQHGEIRPVLRALPFTNSCSWLGVGIAFENLGLALKKDAAEDS